MEWDKVRIGKGMRSEFEGGVGTIVHKNNYECPNLFFLLLILALDHSRHQNTDSYYINIRKLNVCPERLFLTTGKCRGPPPVACRFALRWKWCQKGAGYFCHNDEPPGLAILLSCFLQ